MVDDKEQTRESREQSRRHWRFYEVKGRGECAPKIDEYILYWFLSRKIDTFSYARKKIRDNWIFTALNKALCELKKKRIHYLLVDLLSISHNKTQ